jgi:hypothetical protein
MPQVRWQGRADGHYWIDVALGSRHFSLMIDIGLVDSRNQVGFSIEPVLYDYLKNAGEFSGFSIHSQVDASGKVSIVESGLIMAQLISHVSLLPVGPAVRLHVMRGSPGVPNRVGVVFFHHLKGCHVNWDLDNRIWSIDYP